MIDIKCATLNIHPLHQQLLTVLWRQCVHLGKWALTWVTLVALSKLRPLQHKLQHKDSLCMGIPLPSSAPVKSHTIVILLVLHHRWAYILEFSQWKYPQQKFKKVAHRQCLFAGSGDRLKNASLVTDALILNNNTLENHTYIFLSRTSPPSPAHSSLLSINISE